jgi:hypothetical protein
MDISHDQTDFGLWGPIFPFLIPKSINFVHLYKLYNLLIPIISMSWKVSEGSRNF